MVDNLEIKLNKLGLTFAVGHNHGDGPDGSTNTEQTAVFVAITGTARLGDYVRAFGTFSITDAKQVIAKLQKIVDDYENYRPIDRLGLGAVVQSTDESGLFVNIGGYWQAPAGSGWGTVSHGVVNDWLKNGTAKVKHEGYKSDKEGN